MLRPRVLIVMVTALMGLLALPDGVLTRSSATVASTRTTAVGEMVAGTGAARVALASFTVTNTADSGAGSLRQAILDANVNPDLNNIEFDIPAATDPGGNPLTKVCTIQPLSALPRRGAGGVSL